MWWMRRPPWPIARLDLDLPRLPRCRISEYDRTVEVEVEVPPWCDPDDIEVRIEPRAAHFRAGTLHEVKRDRPPSFHRRQQAWHHSITLPAEVVPQSVRRRTGSGVLHLTLDKA